MNENELIPVNEPLLDGNEATYVEECLRTCWISSDGPFITRFVTSFSARVERKRGVAVANGSAAFDVAVAALGLGPSAEVFLSTFTIISCANSVIRAGATLVVVDCDPVTWSMTVTHVAAAITPRTRAIAVVHIFVRPVDMNPVLALAAKHGLALIEDAAQMHGQTYRGRPCGSFGPISTFSFYANKLVTCGEGGMIVTDDPMPAEKCRMLRNLCFEPERRFVHEEIGWNYRMTNMQVALGLAQLEKLERTFGRKRSMGRRYDEALVTSPHLQRPLGRTEYAESICWVYGLILEDTVPFDAAVAIESLWRAIIGFRSFCWPLAEQPVFKRMRLLYEVYCPAAERIARRGFYPPSGTALINSQIDRVALRLMKFNLS